MNTQQALRGIALLLLGLAAAGCANGKLWTPKWGAARSGSNVAQEELDASGAKQDASSEEVAQAAEVQGPLALARLSERRGQTEQAEQFYETMLKRDTANPLPCHRLGVMKARQGKLDEADAYFARALELAPADANLLRDIGYAHYLQDRIEEAEAALRKALEIEPNNKGASNNLAVLLAEQGNYREALALFRQAVPSRAEAYANLAFLCAQRGDVEQAKANYGRALSIDPKLRAAAEALVQLAEYEPRQTPSKYALPRSELPEISDLSVPRQTTENPIGLPSVPSMARQAAFVSSSPGPENANTAVPGYATAGRVESTTPDPPGFTPSSVPGFAPSSEASSLRPY